ncbi:3-phosphoshikimate 1-carboxyvinyltransferase [bacterium DOLJORAL78_65_58]|nr:MAG: 3-phosphoshikimate 1-carboxyvinyltransferase [bacterium DOLZORAL124_64_63]PIE75691.1 MAG: 3-phosphoshikimate 1-carboxyvinyltransferase [bacterium DOLJORAL78_65_58]
MGYFQGRLGIHFSPGGLILKRILSAARGPLRGRVAVPGDKSISHRAALFTLLADGPCRAEGWLESDDTLRSLEAVAALGGRTHRRGRRITITPPDPDSLGSEPLTLDCGNSGTTTRLLCGLLAGWLPVGGPAVTLTGDASLSSRPMARVVDPLRGMGARITYLGQEGRLPLRMEPSVLEGRICDLEVPSAQVKSALLLAGLFADGRTTVRGAGSSRDHTERLLATMGIPVEGFPGSGDLSLDGPLSGRAYRIIVPADPSSAAFFQVGAAILPGSRVLVPDQSLNPGRAGALRVLERAGARVKIGNRRGAPGEEMGDVEVSARALRAFQITPEDVPPLIDELPILAVLATQAAGETVITGAAELRVKESDRIAATARFLRGMGANIVELRDGWRVIGPTPLHGGEPSAPLFVATHGDHRIAMAAGVAALVAAGTTILDDDACVRVSYPEFFVTLDQLLAGS